jgi:hypothetical protein
MTTKRVEIDELRELVRAARAAAAKLAAESRGYGSGPTSSGVLAIRLARALAAFGGCDVVETTENEGDE